MTAEERREKNIEKLVTLTGESNRNLLSLLLEEAEEDVLIYTNRSLSLPVFDNAIRKLALIAYNRRGTEGETSRSEGGESYNFDNDHKRIFEGLSQYRLARVGGRTHERKRIK